jgi:hypothetical protein
VSDENGDGFDDFDALEGLSEADAQEELLRILRTKGVALAVKTSMEVCADRKAPAAARVQGSSNLFRVNGYFANRTPPAASEKEPHQMTAEELNEAAKLAAAEITARATKKKGGGVFD